MVGKVFINYRRSLTLKDAQLLHKALQRHFGTRGVFLDVSGLDGGDHWLHTLEKQVDASSAVVALIGEGWAEALDDKGQRRIDNPNDFVRFELARAFSRSIPVLPVLIDGAEMPDVSRLPPNLLPLSFPQAMPLRSQTLDDDADRIAKRLRYLIASGRPRGLPYWATGLTALLAMTAGVAAGPALLSQVGFNTVVSTHEQLRAELDTTKAKLTETTRERDAARAETKTAKADAESWKQKHAALEQRLKTESKAGSDSRAPAPKQAAAQPRVGEPFRDCNDGCPEMVVVPSGEFMMGEGSTARKVTIPRSFAVGKFEVTFAEWDSCVAGGGCKHKPDTSWGRDMQPVMRVSWNDAQEYVTWLSRKTGKTYRLLTEAEWEYAARAGTTTTYSWGNEIGRGNANCGGCGSQWDNKQTAPVGSFKANAFGLHDMHGNVWEWVQDCYSSDLSRVPADGSAAAETSGCSRVLRGGSWYLNPQYLRSAQRLNDQPDYRNVDVGFRLART